MTHLKFACKNYQSLTHMSKSGTLLNMPPVKCPSRDCPACLLVKGAKLRRNFTTSLANLRPGQLLMIDFAFSTYHRFVATNLTFPSHVRQQATHLLILRTVREHLWISLNGIF